MANSNAVTGNVKGPKRARHPLDHGGVDSVEFSGSAHALKMSCLGMNAQVPTGLSYENRITMVGIDGHGYEVWGKEFGMYASRPRTRAERIEWADYCNAGVLCSYFSKDRMMLCLDIAIQLQAIAEEMSDAPATRAARMALKKKLAAFAAVQLSLTLARDADMPGLRAQLAAVGLKVKQLPFDGGA